MPTPTDRMSPPSRLATAIAWVLAAVVVALAIAYIGLYLLILDYPFQPYGFPGAVMIFCVTAAVFGALIIGRQPRNGVGWVLLASSLCLAITSTAQVYSVRDFFVAPGSLPLGSIAAWLGSWMWALGVPIIAIFLPLLFPDSNLDGWFAKAVLAFAVVGTAMLAGGLAFYTFPGSAPIQLGRDAQIVGEHSISQVSGFGTVYAVLPLGAFAAIVRLVQRLRRSSGEERQQFKWFAYACALVAFGLLASSIGNFANGLPNSGQGVVGKLSADILVTSLLAIPIGAGIAILRYRLYDIDIVISRTIVYGSMAVVITAVYVAIVAGVGSLIHAAGGGNLLLSIVATAVVAVAFQPLRGRLQRVANRLVYGKQATPYEVLSTFSEGVAETYAGEEVLSRMARLVADATDADRAEVWIAVGGYLRRAAAWPRTEVDDEPTPIAFDGDTLPAIPAQSAIAVRHQGQLLGALTVTKRRSEVLKPVETKLLNDLALQAGLVLRNAGLTESLRARVNDLRDSRQRLVAAQDQERRRLERNLHDGAQQHLVALKVKLGLAKGLAVKDPTKTTEVLGQLEADADEALETLRDLARGIYPPLLADKGLAAALEAQSRKATLPVAVDADGIGRYSQDVEAAVYFCALEALQNVQKYSEATQAEVRLREAGGELIFEVEDDGRGFDPANQKKGSGSQNMEDRLDALGGRVEIVSAVGQGTRLVGRLPVAGSARS